MLRRRYVTLGFRGAVLSMNQDAVLVGQLFLVPRLGRYGPNYIVYAVDVLQAFLARRHLRLALDFTDFSTNGVTHFHLDTFLAVIAHREFALEENLRVILVIHYHGLVWFAVFLLAAPGTDTERFGYLQRRLLTDVGPVSGALTVEAAILDDHGRRRRHRKLERILVDEHIPHFFTAMLAVRGVAPGDGAGADGPRDDAFIVRFGLTDGE